MGLHKKQKDDIIDTETRIPFQNSSQENLQRILFNFKTFFVPLKRNNI